MKRLLAALLLGLCAALAAAADGLVAVPALDARVTDLTGTLGAEQRQRLEERLAAYERTKGSQIAVLMLSTTQPESIEQFGIRVADAWKIGRKGIDDGVIVVVAKDDRRLRIEVGYGLEGALNDATANRIISELMVPHFKRGDYFGGLQAGVEAIISVIEGEPLPAPRDGGARRDGAAEGDWLIWIAAAVILASLARSLLGIVGSFGAAGAAGFFAFTALGGWGIALLAALAVFLLSFVPPSFLLHAASGFGRGRGGGRGSGGFGGRGGGFGGGGASGRW
jgi:uncharacterized protein